jgi:uncharacterized RDD family membrane protein YckC
MKKNSNKIQPSIKYAGLQVRSIATIIDLLIIGLISIPVFLIVNMLLYGNGPRPDEIISAINQESSNLIKEGKTINYDFLVNHPQFKKYFIEEKLYIKLIIDKILQIFLLVFFFFYSWRKKQATFGQRMFSIKIVDAVSLQKPSTKQLIIRLIGCFVSLLPLCLGIFWIAFDPKKQSWHDKMANTLVIVDK